MNIELLKGIAVSDYKENLIKYLKEVQQNIADIRNGNYSNEARIVAIDAIERHIIGQIRVLSGEQTNSIDNWS